MNNEIGSKMPENSQLKARRQKKIGGVILGVMGILLIGLLLILSIKQSEAFIISNNNQKTDFLNFTSIVKNNVCSSSTYNSTCDLVSNNTQDNQNSVLVYKKINIAANDLNESFLNSICNKINSTSWQCKEDYLIQEVKNE